MKRKSQIRRKINDRHETAEKLFTRYIKTVLSEEEGALAMLITDNSTFPRP